MWKKLKHIKTLLALLAAFFFGALFMLVFETQRLSATTSGLSALVNNCVQQTSIEGKIVDLDTPLLNESYDCIGYLHCDTNKVISSLNAATSKRQSLLDQMDKNTKTLDPIIKVLNQNPLWTP